MIDPAATHFCGFFQLLLFFSVLLFFLLIIVGNYLFIYYCLVIIMSCLVFLISTTTFIIPKANSKKEVLKSLVFERRRNICSWDYRKDINPIKCLLSSVGPREKSEFSQELGRQIIMKCEQGTSGEDIESWKYFLFLLMELIIYLYSW